MSVIKQQVEIEICGICGDKLGRNEKNWHFFICAGCLNEFCRHVGNYLELEVTHHAPRGWPITEENPRVAGRQASSSKTVNEFRATFCENCSERVAEILVRAGLTKTVKEERCNVVLD